jgi:hypothetical protein
MPLAETDELQRNRGNACLVQLFLANRAFISHRFKVSVILHLYPHFSTKDTGVLRPKILNILRTVTVSGLRVKRYTILGAVLASKINFIPFRLPVH